MILFIVNAQLNYFLHCRYLTLKTQMVCNNIKTLVAHFFLIRVLSLNESFQQNPSLITYQLVFQKKHEIVKKVLI